MSGPNPPGTDSEGSDTPELEPGEQTAPEDLDVADATGETEIHSRAYSAPESEQFTSGPYVPADAGLYDYDDYAATDLVDTGRPPRWPWVVGHRGDHRRHLAGGVGVDAGLGDEVRQSQRQGWADLHHVGTARAGRDHHHDPAAASSAAAPVE